MLTKRNHRYFSTPSGEVCEVIEVGIRKTRLHDINTDNYVIVGYLDPAALWLDVGMQLIIVYPRNAWKST